MDNYINKLKLVRLIYNKIYPDDNDIISEIFLTEKDFEGIGFSFDEGYLLLKNLHKIGLIKIINNEKDILIYSNEEILLDYINNPNKNNYLEIKDLFFDKEKSILKIKDNPIKITLKNDKPNAHYVLEYIFENDLKEKHYYSDILESKFKNENMNYRSIYRACNDINNKVNKKLGIKDFLIRKSGKTGYAQIMAR